MSLQPQGYELFFPPLGEIDFSRASGRLGAVTQQRPLLLPRRDYELVRLVAWLHHQSLHQRLTRLIVVLSLTGFLTVSDVANAGSFMDFFRAIGNSIAHPEKKSQSRTKGTKLPVSKNAASPKPTLGPSPGLPNEPIVRAGSAAPEAKGRRGDFPYAIPVPGKEGFVTSPFAPESGYVDIHQFPPGTEVKDPFTGKVFLTP
jgi:hypothetical protein